jgi:NADH-quinone oxidoreductase subunit D
VQEARESVKIIQQCIDQIEPGPVRPSFADVPRLLRPPEGDVYQAIESSKGELGYYLVSDGGIAPYRMHVRAPSLLNLTLLRDMLIGGLFGDLFVSFGSVDLNMGEVDR